MNSPSNRTVVRPDPTIGREANTLYAEQWAESHDVESDNLSYRTAYVDLLAADTMFSRYRLLDVGCGTGGYLRLLKNASEIVGIDFSRTMIEKAAAFDIPRATFECSRFEEFQSERPFNVIRLVGVFGWYLPWPGNEGILVRAGEMLDPQGVLIVSFVPPRNAMHWIKTLAMPARTVVFPTWKFRRMASDAGFRHLFSIATEQSVFAFLTPSARHA